MSLLHRAAPRIAGLCWLGLAAAAIAAPAAGATAASATLTAGSLGFVSASPAITFPATPLTGLNQSVTASQAFDVGDATGSGAGWNLTATSTTFTAAKGTLPTSATTIASVPAPPACDAGSSCTAASASVGVSYPYSLPAGASAPAATKMYSASSGTGLGDQTLTPSWTLSIPSKAVAGSYTATWTVSLVSGP